MPVVGITNLVTMVERTEAYRRDLRRVEYGDERDPKMREYLERIAPLNHAEKMRKPILAVAGKNDPRVPWTETQQMLDRLRAGGGAPWLLLANDEGHGFVKKKNQGLSVLRDGDVRSPLPARRGPPGRPCALSARGVRVRAAPPAHRRESRPRSNGWPALSPGAHPPRSRLWISTPWRAERCHTATARCGSGTRWACSSR